MESFDDLDDRGSEVGGSSGGEDVEAESEKQENEWNHDGEALIESAVEEGIEVDDGLRLAVSSSKGAGILSCFERGMRAGYFLILT